MIDPISLPSASAGSIWLTAITIASFFLTFLGIYHKIYAPIVSRLVKMEEFREGVQTQSEHTNDALDKILEHVQEIREETTQISTTLWGAKGDNGFRSRLTMLEKAVTDNHDRIIVLENT